jgi:hypothetical protein
MYQHCYGATVAVFGFTGRSPIKQTQNSFEKHYWADGKVVSREEFQWKWRMIEIQERLLEEFRKEQSFVSQQLDRTSRISSEAELMATEKNLPICLSPHIRLLKCTLWVCIRAVSISFSPIILCFSVCICFVSCSLALSTNSPESH